MRSDLVVLGGLYEQERATSIFMQKVYDAKGGEEGTVNLEDALKAGTRQAEHSCVKHQASFRESLDGDKRK